MNIPISAGIIVKRSGEISLGIGAFDSRGAYVLTTSVGELAAKVVSGKRGGPRLPLKKLWRFFRIKRISVEVALSDACSTALVAGAIGCALSTMRPRSFSVLPLFNSDKPAFGLECIISIDLWHAFYAAILMATAAVKERMKSGT
ncbi:MAG: hypothetical protein Q4D04_04690 [Clostridia bacterium]|nr:hypothetical protein [Clostridia bacterium]